MPLWRALQTIEQGVCRQHDLAVWDYVVLIDVRDHPDTTQLDVANRIVRSPSRLVGDLDGLMQRGLLTRRRDEADRRVHRLRLSRTGASLAWRAQLDLREREGRLLEHLTTTEQARLRQLLARASPPMSSSA
ncbi:MAG: MarR family transcriptional regulator [Actinomycetota bacterium]|nr:MarR family transcriptional regulator [Actinomycetota bacterium]